MARNDGTRANRADSLEKKNMSKKTRRGTQKKLNELPSHVRVRSSDSNLGAFSFAKTADENFAVFHEPRARRERDQCAGRGDAETRRRASSRVFSAHTPSSPARAMKLKQLESLLQDVEPFREPDQMLEQYPTGAHLASRVVAEAHAHGDIEGRAVVDLGVGGGVLTIASLLMGAAKVTGLDLDPNALDLTRENCAAFDPPLEPALAIASIPRDVARLRRRVTREEIRSVDARDARERHDAPTCRERTNERTDTNEVSTDGATNDDVTPEAPEDYEFRDSPMTSFLALRADTVIMNPPFGTRRRGADLGFLRAGLMLARNAVYSLNKTSTRAHVERHATRALRAASATVLAELRYELPKTYAHHRRESVEIEVDLWRFEPPRDGRVGRGKRESEDTSSGDSSSETESESRASASESDSEPLGEPSGSGALPKKKKEETFPELKYAGARGAFCDRRDFEPRRAGRSGGKGARDSRAQIAGGRESAGRGRGGGRSGGGGRGRGRR